MQARIQDNFMRPSSDRHKPDRRQQTKPPPRLVAAGGKNHNPPVVQTRPSPAGEPASTFTEDI